MNEITQTIQDTPGLALVPGLLVIAAGLILWSAGRRVLRPALALTGGVMGVGLGWVLAGFLATRMPEYAPPTWAAAITVGVVLALLGALLYRLAVAGTLAVVGVVALPAVVLMIAQWSAPEPPSAGTDAPAGEAAPAAGTAESGAAGPLDTLIDEANDWLYERDREAPPPPPEPEPDDAQDSRSSGSSLPTADELLLGPEAAERLEKARGHAERAAGAAGDWWDRIPPSSHRAVVGAAIVGILAGLLLGTLAPSVSAMIVTAFTGAALVLTGFTMILARLEAVEAPASGAAAPWLLLVWLVLSIIGLAIQWTFRPKPADTPA